MIISKQKINFSVETRSNIAVMETKLEKCYDKKPFKEIACASN